MNSVPFLEVSQKKKRKEGKARHTAAEEKRRRETELKRKKGEDRGFVGEVGNLL